MNKTAILNRIEKTGVLAIVRAETIEKAEKIAEACMAGGVDCMEISYTFPNAGEVIRHLKRRYGKQLVVGAGTVLDSETARLAILSGAEFVIAPNFQESVCKLCNRYQMPYMPGCSSVTEAITALEAGAAMIKAFPISNYYGPSLVSTFKTPLPYLPILSSGNATLENIGEWLDSGVDCVGVGSLLTKGSSQEITEHALVFSQAVKAHRRKATNADE